MKIEIEFIDNGNAAKVTIGNRELVCRKDGCVTSYRDDDIKPDEQENTIGGLLACKLSWEILSDILGTQAMQAATTGEVDLWQILVGAQADQFYDDID